MIDVLGIVLMAIAAALAVTNSTRMSRAERNLGFLILHEAYRTDGSLEKFSEEVKENPELLLK